MKTQLMKSNRWMTPAKFWLCCWKILMILAWLGEYAHGQRRLAVTQEKQEQLQGVKSVKRVVLKVEAKTVGEVKLL